VRHLLSRKTWFYHVLLPVLRRLEPGRADAVLLAIGRALPLKQEHRGRVLRAGQFLEADWRFDEVLDKLAGNRARFAARDYLLSGLSDFEALGRFEVSGLQHLEQARATGTGLILLGSHFGAYLAALHWLARIKLPLRMLVQKPHHVSPELAELFDSTAGQKHPQSAFWLKREMGPGEGAQRIWHARAILREGNALYVNGDVAWPSGCVRLGRLLGREKGFLGAWADLAAMTGAPVVPFFVRHLHGGRYELTFEAPWEIRQGEQGTAVARYLRRLEAQIAAHPQEAIAYLTWPSFAEEEFEPIFGSTMGQAMTIPGTRRAAV
jgi:phosphatidylinositol dimannoside acyltransferase